MSLNTELSYFIEVHRNISIHLPVNCDCLTLTGLLMLLVDGIAHRIEVGRDVCKENATLNL